MLGSLIKYEFKATYKMFFLLYALVLFFGFVIKYMIVTDSNFSIIIDYYFKDTSLVELAYLGVTFTYLILLAAVGVLTIFIIVRRFYKNMFSDTGYLMNTLPVEPWKHILSKLFAAVVWLFCGMGVCFFSIVIILSNEMTFYEILDYFTDVIILIFSEEKSAYLFISFIVYFFVQQTANIMTVYLALSIGQLFNSYRKTMAFTAFIVINVVTNVLAIFLYNKLFTTVNMEYNTIEYNVNLEVDYFLNMFIMGIIINAIIFAAGFVVTNYIMKNKLNLE